MTKKNSKIAPIIIKHVKDNLKPYIIVSLILLIGIILGVFFVNNMNEVQANEVQNYLINFVNSLEGRSKHN